ncbi:MAG: DIP1984 family protein [Lentisphaeria bacterium]|nr:DIP1984 family protein [Lentisphaeria bacterium]NQZ67024.1 DIP1984 family protein [Lentisphaeria bacterium]
MKIAEALLLRADLQKKLASLRERSIKYAVTQEGVDLPEDPKALIKESVSVLKELEKLVCKINKANSDTTLSDGRTIAEAIAGRERLAKQHSLLQAVLEGSSHEPDRYSMSEIKWISTVNVKSMQKELEDISKKLRELNAKIQEMNWQAELA